MTNTRSTLVSCASRWAWLLPLGLVELSAACGSSPSMIGESAGAAGASAGSAGASSTNGGSDTGSGGSSTSHAGTAGNATSGGGSEAGGTSVGGASGSSNGGASGSSNTGGSSTGGSAGSSACSAAAPCPDGYDCLYKMADGCTAKGSCFKAPGGALCASVSPYCGCSGQVVDVPCYDPSGYSPAPVSSPQSSASCSMTPDAACVGKSCGAGCGTGEVPAVCDAAGKCILGGAPICK